MTSVREAKFEDMPLTASIMVTSFRTAFAAFVSPETMDAEHLYRLEKFR
jgi:hypothetical protein